MAVFVFTEKVVATKPGLIGPSFSQVGWFSSALLLWEEEKKKFLRLAIVLDKVGPVVLVCSFH